MCIRDRGYQATEKTDEADFIAMNTCLVRENAEQKVFGQIGALKKWKTDRPNRILALCGCMMQTGSAKDVILQSYPQVDLIFGTHNIARLPQLVEQVKETEERIVDISSYEDCLLYTSLACGGKSYPSTGSTGDGYRFAKAFGHSLVPLSPALVPILLQDDFVSSWEGVSLKNITLNASWGNRKESLFGEMLFTHDGISGPVVLTLSSLLSGKEQNDVVLSLDWKPAMEEEVLRRRLLRERQNLSLIHISTKKQESWRKICTTC